MNANRRPSLDPTNVARFNDWMRRSARQMTGKANHYGTPRPEVVEHLLPAVEPRHRADVSA